MVESYLATAQPERFNVVTLLNVLEHLTEPRQMLLQLRELMSPGGLLTVVVPDARFHDFVGKIRHRMGCSDSYWLEQSKSVLAGFKLPDHLCSFQPRTITRMVKQCGFDIRLVENAPVVLNPQPYRNVLKLSVRAAGQLLYYASFGRLVFGYSTLLIASKT